MKLALVSFAIVLGLAVTTPAFAESVATFDAHVAVAADGQLTVTETIVYDFGGIDHHGIFRTIPYHYTRDTLNYNIRLGVVSVTDENNQTIPYSQSRSGGALTLRIGNPNTFVSGIHTYVLTYTVDRAINWFDGEPEIYWNVTGNDWDVTIEKATSTLSGAFEFRVDATRCFTGTIGSQETDCTVETSEPGSVYIAANNSVISGDGLTAVVRLPAGSIPEPSPLDRVIWVIRDNWGFVLPFITLMALVMLYRRYGRDPRGRGTIIAQYEPPDGMSPAMLGYLIDEKIDPRDISAAIIGLATRGFLRIHYHDKTLGHTYKLERLKTGDSTLSSFDRGLLEGLFEKGTLVELKDLKRTLPKKLKELKGDLEDEAQRDQYFPTAPSHIRSVYATVGGLMLFAGFFLIGEWTALGLGLVFSGGLFLGFAPAMPRKTEHGVEAVEHIKGFKDFLTVTEKDRVKFHQAPDKKPEQFFSYLPYAIALSVEKDWAKQFKDITLEQPDWYTGQDWSLFNAYIFASAMSDFSSSTRSQAITPASAAGAGTSGFGGGGFSGGGFGGGGGGSW